MSTPSSLDPNATNARRRRNLAATTGDTNQLVARIRVAVLGRNQQAALGVELTVPGAEHHIVLGVEHHVAAGHPSVLFTVRIVTTHGVE